MFCIDKPKFGGSSKKKKHCIVQKCERNATTMPSTHLNEGRDISYHVHYMFLLYLFCRTNNKQPYESAATLSG